MSSSFKNLGVVLVRAENPINIGQTARAMKNFGAPKLHLVQCADHTCEEAITPGWKARDLLKKASCYKNLDDAVKKAAFTVGFTARSGKYRTKARPFPAMIPEILNMLKNRKVLLVYGNEKNGLSNEELSKCHAAAVIPSSKEYASLNLAHAAAVSLGMLYSAAGNTASSPEKDESFYPKPGELEAFLNDLKRTLQLLDYADNERNDLLPRVYEHLKNFFRHAGMDKKDLHLFHSLISRTNQRLKR